MSKNFILDYINTPTEEAITKFRNSNRIQFRNLEVTDNMTIGKVNINDGHVTINKPSDNVIYFDSETNILQSAYTEDLDVINTNKNTSFVDYTHLSRTYYTKIGGNDDEINFRNNKCCAYKYI